VSVSFVPAGMHQITPHLTVSSAAKAIDFYKQAFGAKELARNQTPNGKIMHAHITIGDSHVLLNDPFPEMDGAPAPSADAHSPFAIQLYVPDADATFAAATAAGAKVTMPLTDMFWGDRYGQLVDPFGYRWSVATHKENVAPAELERRAKEMFSKMGAGKSH